MHDIMVDIETLSKYPDGAILSIAIIPFKFSAIDTMQELVDRALYLKLNVKDQLAKSRKTEKSTLDWWKNQSEEAKSILKPSSEDLTIVEALDKMDEYCDEWINKRESFFWARGAHFDFPFLDDLYRHEGRDLPWNCWNVQCTKTFIRTLTGNMRASYNLEGGVPKEFVAHDARYDAAHEVLKIQEIGQKFYG